MLEWSVHFFVDGSFGCVQLHHISPFILKNIIKQVCLTTDNGGMNIVACSMFWTQPSLGYITNAIKDDSCVSRNIGVARKLITSFSHSWKKKRIDQSSNRTRYSAPFTNY